ncbi:nad dependent epimerase [Neofusicoccum parvum]|nr:nad dependent epimerase [Neofusicoccum parvum]
MSRLIDKEPNLRTKPMQVVCLGMSRTGTLGLYWSLNLLGYRTYHMVEILNNGERDLNLTVEAYKAKYEDGRPYGREELDRWYGQYDAVCDLPAWLFVEEMYAAYPDAKFILTDRNVDDWVRSMHNTVFAATASKFIRALGLIDWVLMRPFRTICINLSIDHCGWGDDTRTAEVYRQHVERVKATIPSEQLLYLRLEEGITWEKLCTFLDKPVPDVPIPSGKKNGPGNFDEIAQAFVSRAILGVARRFLLYSCVPAIAAGAWYLRRQPGGLRLPWL